MKHVVQSALNKFGYRIIRIDKCAETGHAQGLDPFFNLLKQCSFAPRHIIDVGANKGIWTRVAIKHFPAAQYTLLEPQDHLKEYVQDLIDHHGFRINWINVGASDKPVSHRNDSSTFVLPEPEVSTSGHKTVTVPVATLNEIVACSKAPFPEMVKIDAEGLI